MSNLDCGELYIDNSTAVILSGAEAEVEVDGVLELVPLTDTLEVDGEEKTVTCVFNVLLKSTRVAIAGGSNLPMQYTGTPGRFRGVAPASLSLSEETRYIIQAIATVEDVGVGTWECEKVAKRRDGSSRT